MAPALRRTPQMVAAVQPVVLPAVLSKSFTILLRLLFPSTSPMQLFAKLILVILTCSRNTG